MVLFPHQFCFWIFAMHIDDDFLDTTQRYVMRHLCEDRKSTRLNSSHLVISYAVFCLKKKKHNSYTSYSCHCRTLVLRVRLIRRQPPGRPRLPASSLVRLPPSLASRSPACSRCVGDAV